MNCTKLSYSLQTDFTECVYLVCLAYATAQIQKMMSFLNMYHMDHAADHHWGRMITIMSTCWRIRVVSVIIGRNIGTSSSTTTISSCRAERVLMIIIGVPFMQIATSVFSVSSMVVTFLLKISLSPTLRTASVSSIKDFFATNISMMGTRDTLIMDMIKPFALRMVQSKRMICTDNMKSLGRYENVLLEALQTPGFVTPTLYVYKRDHLNDNFSDLVLAPLQTAATMSICNKD